MSDLSGLDIGGRYHIIEKLGQGGMATVYKAYDTNLDREVAVKLIRKEAVGAEHFEHLHRRFAREARALAKLTHPNIVPILDFGEYDHSPYFVMAYITGGTLKQSIVSPLPFQRAAQLLHPIACALDYAHENHIIHRDVKPANILITDKGQPMLSDFGIAKILDIEESGTLTGEGLGIGTPEYMAPEQWVNQVVPQTDIYALGVIFFELVTGQKPYTADTPAAVLLKQANDPLPRPKSIVPTLPDQVEQVIFKALAKKPEDRFASMGDFAEALQSLAGNNLTFISPLLSPGADQISKEQIIPTAALNDTVDVRLTPIKPVNIKTKSKWLWPLTALGGILIILAAFLSYTFLSGSIPGSFLVSNKVNPTQPGLISTHPAAAAADLTPIGNAVQPNPVITQTTATTPKPLPYTWSRMSLLPQLKRSVIRSVVIDPRDPGVMYAGTTGAGIYRSLDGGASWQPAQNGLKRSAINTILIDPNNPKKLYTHTMGNGPYVSQDGGANWSALTFHDNEMDQFGDFVFDPQDNHLIFTVINNGAIYKFNSDNQTWTPIKTGGCPSNINSLTVDPTHPGILYAGDWFINSECEPGIYKSMDDGISWKKMSIPNLPTRFAFEKTRDGKQFLYTVNHYSWSPDTYVSGDGGDTWNQLPLKNCRALTSESSGSILGICDQILYRLSEGGQKQEKLGSVSLDLDTYMGLTIAPSEPNLIVAYSRNLLISKDGGKTFQESTNGLGLECSRVRFYPYDPGSMFIQGFCGIEGGNNGSGVLGRSADGGRSWKQINQTANGVESLSGLEFDPDGKTLYSSVYASILNSFNMGNSWEGLYKIPNFSKYSSIPFLSSNPFKPGMLFMMQSLNDSSGLLSISLDKGKTWGESQHFPVAYYQIFFSQEKGNILYMNSWSSLRTSTDQGKSWQDCTSSWLPMDRYNSILAIDPRNNKHIYLATLGQGVQESKDGCMSFEGLFSDQSYINMVILDQKNPDRLFAASDQGVYLTLDAGKTWSPINAGLLGVNAVYSVDIDPRNSENVYASTPYGLFKLEKTH